VGTAYQAVFNRALARRSGGQFLLRIEDTDQARFDPASEGMIFRALGWLDLGWDEGPDVGGPHAPYRQSERTALYREHAQRLVESGAGYRCFCTAERLDRLRAAQNAAKQPPRYDRTCAALARSESDARAAAAESHVVRLRIPSEGTTVVKDGLRGDIPFENALLDDQVLLKSDGFPTYHLANVVDDRLMEITHVVRGEEWLASTPKHQLLYAALGWEPPLFYHTPLLRNTDRSKLSKRRNPTSLDWYRDEGYLPEALVNFLCTMGWSHPEGKDFFGWQEFTEHFTLERIHLGGPIFDLAKLAHLNGLWIRSLTVEALCERIVAGGFTRHAESPLVLLAAVALTHDRLTRLGEFDDLTAFFFEDPAPAADEMIGKAERAAVRAAVEAFRARAAEPGDWTSARLEAIGREIAEAGPLKKKELFMALRVAVTGRAVSTPLFETLAAIGRAAALRRLESAVATLAG
jgi:glutamyl-tRNA synthetase